MIRIINLRNYKLHEDEVLIRVDRQTVVGNPFFMKDESMRDTVCDKYEQYFNTHVQQAGKFKQYIDNIIEQSKTKDIALGCWCYPKRCHAETILRYVQMKEEANRIIDLLEKCCAKKVPYLELNLHKDKKLLAEIDNISDIEVAKLVIKYMLKKIYRLYFFYS